MKKIKIVTMVTVTVVLSSGLSPGMGNIRGCAETAVEKAGVEKRTDETRGQTAPAFTLKKLGSEETVSLADFSGKPVFIDFWASWCPPCRAASPDVERLHQMFGDKAQILGVNIDRNPEAGLDYARKQAMSYMQLEGYGSDVPASYGVSGIPAFFLIDGQGEIAYRWVGYSENYMEEWVNVLEKLVE